MRVERPDHHSIEARLDEAITKAIAKGGNPDESKFWDALRLPEDGSKDLIPFDPSQARIKRGRIKLPGMGWVRVDGIPVPPRDAKLVKVEVRRDGDGWEVNIELATQR